MIHFLSVGLGCAQPAADTLKMTLVEADSAFLQKSFVLLAARYEIDVANANIIQVKLWTNPTLSIEQGAYDQARKKWFDLSRNGETMLSLDQLIHLDGQRGKSVAVSKIQATMANDQFYDVVRNLKYDLHTSFYRLYFLRQSIGVFDTEIKSLRVLVAALTDQANKGNVSKIELMRLLALQFGLEKDRNDLLTNAADEQSRLRLLTGETGTALIEPEFIPASFDHIDPAQLDYVRLLDSAMENRSDLKMAEAQISADRANQALQKSLRIPDLTIGANYDRQGSYIRNYNSLSLGLDIPIWNRNQGNIKMSDYRIRQSTINRNEVEAVVADDVSKSYTAFINTDSLYQSSRQSFTEDYLKLLNGITTSYGSHTISLIQFVDYYEAYKNSLVAFNELQSKRLEALESINLATGIEVVK